MTKKIICIDGIEGTGKSTTVEKLKEYFSSQNISHAVIKFPSYMEDGVLSKCIRERLFTPSSVPMRQNIIDFALLFTDALFNYQKAIDLINKDTDVVICDRSIISNIVYQYRVISKVDDDIDDIVLQILETVCYILNQLGNNKLYTIILQASTDVIHKRLSLRNKNNTQNILNINRLDELAEIFNEDTQIFTNYRKLISPIKYIDTSINDADAVVESILTYTMK